MIHRVYRVVWRQCAPLVLHASSKNIKTSFGLGAPRGEWDELLPLVHHCLWVVLQPLIDLSTSLLRLRHLLVPVRDDVSRHSTHLRARLHKKAPLGLDHRPEHQRILLRWPHSLHLLCCNSTNLALLQRLHRSTNDLCSKSEICSKLNFNISAEANLLSFNLVEISPLKPLLLVSIHKSAHSLPLILIIASDYFLRNRESTEDPPPENWNLDAEDEEPCITSRAR